MASQSNFTTHEEQLSELGATSELLLPVVASRIHSDPSWAEAMLFAIHANLVEIQSLSGDFSVFAALEQAHKLAGRDRISEAAIMVELALRKPEFLSDNQLNARVLFASLLERQGQFVQAAEQIEIAASLAPDDPDVQKDRDRIIKAREAAKG